MDAAAEPTYMYLRRASLYSTQHSNLNTSPRTNYSGGVGLGLEPYAAWMLHQSLHGCNHGEFQTQPHSTAFSF